MSQQGHCDKYLWEIHPVHSFAGFASVWNDLNAQGLNVPILAHKFVEPLLEYFASSRDVVAVCSGMAKRKLAMAVFTRSRPGKWHTLHPDVAPLGLWVCKKGLSPHVFLPGLFRALPGFPVQVSVTKQDPLLAPPPTQGKLIRVIDDIQTPAVTVSMPFDEYWSTRSKNSRHNVKRLRNRLRRNNVATLLEVLTRPDDMKRALQDYSRLELAGWKGKAGTAIDLATTEGQFYTKVFDNFAKEGGARIYRYFFDSKLVAMDLCVVRGGMLCLLKITYDEEERASAPATLMRQEQFEEVMNSSSIKRIEFYGPLMDWHKKWANEVRTTYYIDYFRWTMLADLHDRMRRW